MKRPDHFRVSLIVVSIALIASAGHAQETYDMNASILLGLGGSVDESDPGYGNVSFQLGFAAFIEDRTQIAIRLGQLGFDDADALGGLFGPDLTYITLSGEYRGRRGFFSGALFDSGMFIGLGVYKLDGTRADGVEEDSTSVGLTVGVSGDFDVSRRLAIRIEGSGHVTDLDEAQFFILGHAGLVVRF